MGVLSKLKTKSASSKVPAVLFIDPGSYRAGYAVFSPTGEKLKSGAFQAYGDKVAERLAQIALCYSSLTDSYEFEAIVLERMNSRVHFYVQWVSAAIITTITIVSGFKDYTFCTPGQWKAYLKGFGLITTPVQQTCDPEEFDKVGKRFGSGSGDETVAIVMGYRHFSLTPPKESK